jgi:hypothetical protein
MIICHDWSLGWTCNKANKYLLAQFKIFLLHIQLCMQEKYDEAMASLTQMENRAVMAETMLEATLQYQSSQQKAQLPSPSPSPRYHCLV